MSARFVIGDTREVLATLPEQSVDLVLSSPPFLALRSYLPADHPDKALEIGSEATPGEFIDTLLDVVEACARVLTPYGTLVFELGDTYSGSGGAVIAAETAEDEFHRMRMELCDDDNLPDRRKYVMRAALVDARKAQ